MKSKELRSRITLRPSGYGHYEVVILFRGRNYHCKTNNMPAVDAAKDPEQNSGFLYTHKQGLLSLWNECKRKNNLA